MPTAEEFALWGAYELSFEELLEVNGGRHVIGDPSTDDVSDTIANGGHSPGGSSSSSDSGSSGGSSGGSSSAPPSSSPSGPVTGSDSDDTGGSTCDGWNNYWNGLTSGGSSGGGSSGSTGGSSGNSDSSGDSSSNDSSGDDYSSGDDSDSGYWGGGGSGYTPPAQSQPAPKPNRGEEKSPTQGGGSPRGGDTPSEQKQPKITQGAEKQDGEKLKNFFNSENNVGIKPDMNFPIDMSKVTNIGEYGPREKIEIGDEETKPFHGGMDFAAPADTDIFSATDGWVRENGNNNIYGNYVVISDDKGWSGTLTYYAHMNQASDFTVGTQVEKGQKIGSVGSTGLSTGPHLHFEVRTNYGQTKHDPRDFLPFLTQTGSFE